MLCWLVIAGCVAAMFGSNAARKSRGAIVDQGPSAQQLIAARYAVGWAAIAERLSGAPADNTARALAAQARATAKSATETFHAAVITATIEGSDAARPLFRQVAADTTNEPLRRDAGDVLDILDGRAPSQEVRQRLIDRHEWIGRMATVLHLASNDPARRAVVSPAKRTAGTLFGFGICLMAVAAAGLVLFITAIVLVAVCILRSAAAPPASRDVALLEAFTLYLALMTASIAWRGAGLPGGAAVGLPLALLSFIVGLAWPLWRGVPRHNLAAALGLSRGGGVLWEIGCGVIGYIALIPLLIVGFIITVMLTRAFNAEPSHPITDLITGPLWQFVLIAILAAVFAPITEELLFRGAFFGYLRTQTGWIAAAIIVGVIFAAIHPQGWAAIPVLSIIGINLAILRQWRGSLIAAVTAHALNNGTLVLVSGLMLR